jgi:hypothetical protein
VNACSDAAARTALRARPEVQRCLGGVAVRFVDAVQALRLLAEDPRDCVCSARDVGVVALRVRDAIDVDLDDPTGSFSPESGHASLHVAARFLQVRLNHNPLRLAWVKLSVDMRESRILRGAVALR